MGKRRLTIPYKQVARALDTARARLVRVQGPDWEAPETEDRFRAYVTENHATLVSAAQHEVTTALKTPTPRVTLAARAGAAYEVAWLRAVRGVNAVPEQFRVLATLTLAGGLLSGRDLTDAEADAEWVTRTVVDAFDPRLIVHGAEWAGAAAIPILKGRWAVGAALGLLAMTAAAPALTGAFVLHEARRSTRHESAPALLPDDDGPEIPSFEAPPDDASSAGDATPA